MKKLISLLCFCCIILCGCNGWSSCLLPHVDGLIETNSEGDLILDGVVYKRHIKYHSPECLLSDELIRVGGIYSGHFSSADVYVSDRDIERNLLADPSWLYLKENFQFPNFEEITYSKIVLPYQGIRKCNYAFYDESESTQQILLAEGTFLKDVFDMDNLYQGVLCKEYYIFYLQSTDFPYLGWGNNRWIAVSENKELYLHSRNDEYHKIKDEYVAEFERMIAEYEALQATKTTN